MSALRHKQSFENSWYRKARRGSLDRWCPGKWSTNQYGVATFIAVLKARNYRSEALLRKLGFVPASDEQVAQHRDEPDELVLVKPAPAAANAA